MSETTVDALCGLSWLRVCPFPSILSCLFGMEGPRRVGDSNFANSDQAWLQALLRAGSVVEWLHAAAGSMPLPLEAFASSPLR